MAYDEHLAERARMILRTRSDLDERKMFGGLALMVHGHMCCGVVNDDLIVRMAPDEAARAVDEPHTRPMDFTGRAMRGFVFVGPGGTRKDADLERWVGRAVTFVDTLPPKRR